MMRSLGEMWYSPKIKTNRNLSQQMQSKKNNQSFFGLLNKIECVLLKPFNGNTVKAFPQSIFLFALETIP